MSTTLTWFSSGNGTKSGTDATAYFNDLIALVNSKSADTNFKWQVAGSTVSGSAYQLVLKRKNGTPGRILLLNYVSTPGGFHPTIFDQAPGLSTVYCTYFPNGNTDTASSLTSTSGTIMGNDTAAIKAAPDSPIYANYGSSYVHYYFESDAGMIFVQQDPSSAPSYMMGAGELVVDGTDSAYSCVISSADRSLNTLGLATGLFTWQASSNNTNNGSGGNTFAGLNVNFNGNNKRYYQAWNSSGAWGARSGNGDLLLDDSNSLAYFFPIQLLGQTRGEGLVLKLRQIAFGPGQLSQFSVFNITGPSVAARAINNNTNGAAGVPWLVNFKI